MLVNGETNMQNRNASTKMVERWFDTTVRGTISMAQDRQEFCRKETSNHWPQKVLSGLYMITDKAHNTDDCIVVNAYQLTQ